MKFDIEREGSYSFDFVKDNMDNILACIACRDEKFKRNYNERKRSYQNLFNSNGLITGNVKPIGGDIQTRREIRKKDTYWQYELSDFWEGFAEFILQKDFIFLQKTLDDLAEKNGLKKFWLDYDEREKFYQNLFNLTIGNVEPKGEKKKYWQYDYHESFGEFIHQKDFIFFEKILDDLAKKIGLEKYFLYEEIKELYLECSYKYSQRDILLDILKRKYEFEKYEFENRLIERLTIIRNIDNNDIKVWVNKKNGLRNIYALTSDEFDEYKRRRSEIRSKIYEHVEAKFEEIKNTPEYIKAEKGYMEARIKKAEKVVSSCKIVLKTNDIILTPEESQLLRDCLVDESIFALDLFGITKPTASFSFPKTFYFIEVKSISKKFGTVYLSPLQKRFIEKAKGKFGILITHIKVEPHDVTVRYLSPK